MARLSVLTKVATYLDIFETFQTGGEDAGDADRPRNNAKGLCHLAGLNEQKEKERAKKEN
jgi:hypothetical protein